MRQYIKKDFKITRVVGHKSAPLLINLSGEYELIKTVGNYKHFKRGETSLFLSMDQINQAESKEGLKIS